MANQSRADFQIVDSWSLKEFCKQWGNPKWGTFTSNGETFNSLMFVGQGGKHFPVNISSKLESVTCAKDVVQSVDNLRVIKSDSGSYILCKRGANSWDDINIL